jgi:hypothetical protein
MVELAEKVTIRHPLDANHVDIQKDPFHPEAYIITLPLDSDPSYVWHTLFTQELWSSLDFWDRKVVLTGKTLRLVTTTDHVEEKLHWLEAVVTATNRRVDDYNKRAKAEENARKAKVLDQEAIRKNLSNWELNRVRA